MLFFSLFCNFADCKMIISGLVHRFVLTLLLTLLISCELIDDCSVVIVGGSTSALAAAYTSAAEGIKTCLLEPTNWIGGQLTASGVTAIDFSWITRKQGNEVSD